jgi:hypothetical protein
VLVASQGPLDLAAPNARAAARGEPDSALDEAATRRLAGAAAELIDDGHRSSSCRADRGTVRPAGVHPARAV